MHDMVAVVDSGSEAEKAVLPQRDVEMPQVLMHQNAKSILLCQINSIR
jgi:hypothetical protein